MIHNLCHVLIVKKKKSVLLKNLLNEAVKMISFIKSRSLYRCLNMLGDISRSRYKTLLLHAVAVSFVQWFEVLS